MSPFEVVGWGRGWVGCGSLENGGNKSSEKLRSDSGPAFFQVPPIPCLGVFNPKCPWQPTAACRPTHSCSALLEPIPEVREGHVCIPPQARNAGGELPCGLLGIFWLGPFISKSMTSWNRGPGKQVMQPSNLIHEATQPGARAPGRSLKLDALLTSLPETC